MTDLSSWSESEQLEVLHGLIEEIHWGIDALLEAQTITSQGHYLSELNNLVDQIITWHPRYDYETGQIEEEQPAEPARQTEADEVTALLKDDGWGRV